MYIGSYMVHWYKICMHSANDIVQHRMYNTCVCVCVYVPVFLMHSALWIENLKCLNELHIWLNGLNLLLIILIFDFIATLKHYVMCMRTWSSSFQIIRNNFLKLFTCPLHSSTWKFNGSCIWNLSHVYLLMACHKGRFVKITCILHMCKEWRKPHDIMNMMKWPNFKLVTFLLLPS